MYGHCRLIICSSIYPYNTSIHLYVCPLIHLSIDPSIHLSNHVSIITFNNTGSIYCPDGIVSRYFFKSILMNSKTR